MPELLFATIKSILVSVPYGTLWSIMWRLVSEKQTESIFEMWIQYTRCVTSYNNINNMSRSLDIYLYIIVHGEFTRHICIYICIYRVHSTYKYIRVSCLGMNVVWVTIYHRSDLGEYQEYWHISISRTRHMNTIRSYVEFTRHLHIYLCMSSSLDIRLCQYWKLSGLDIYTYIFMYVEFTRHTLVSSDRLHMQFNPSENGDFHCLLNLAVSLVTLNCMANTWNDKTSHRIGVSRLSFLVL